MTAPVRSLEKGPIGDKSRETAEHLGSSHFQYLIGTDWNHRLPCGITTSGQSQDNLEKRTSLIHIIPHPVFVERLLIRIGILQNPMPLYAVCTCLHPGLSQIHSWKLILPYSQTQSAQSGDIRHRRQWAKFADSMHLEFPASCQRTKKDAISSVHGIVPVEALYNTTWQWTTPLIFYGKIWVTHL